MRNHYIQWSALAVCVLLFTACGSIEVTKRRHMPGYHVEVNGKRQQPAPDREHAEVSRPETEQTGLATSMEPKSAVVMTPQTDAEVPLAAADVTPVHAGDKKAPKKLEQVLPSIEGDNIRLGETLRRAVFAEEGDEKVGWSVVSFISFGLGVVAFVMMFVALAWMIGLTGPWFIPAIVGLMFGIGALITGVIGIRQTRRGGRKGRGFALAGMITGIVGLAISLISLLVGVFRTFLDNN